MEETIKHNHESIGCNPRLKEYDDLKYSNNFRVKNIRIFPLWLLSFSVMFCTYIKFLHYSISFISFFQRKIFSIKKYF
jgi:hypothetical protein